MDSNEEQGLTYMGIPIIVSPLMKPNDVKILCGEEYYKTLVAEYEKNKREVE